MELPDGMVLVYREQYAHPFLAEYQMRLEIRPPGGEARHFDLGFTLRDPRMIPAESVVALEPAGAFTGVNSHLRRASVSGPADRELYEATRGYRGR